VCLECIHSIDRLTNENVSPLKSIKLRRDSHNRERRQVPRLRGRGGGGGWTTRCVCVCVERFPCLCCGDLCASSAGRVVVAKHMSALHSVIGVENKNTIPHQPPTTDMYIQ
ncbi:unnamed protein product, partial [Ectocarpus sp. 13 AM-2016]